jgi:hypothetical protein
LTRVKYLRVSVIDNFITEFQYWAIIRSDDLKVVNTKGQLPLAKCQNYIMLDLMMIFLF